MKHKRHAVGRLSRTEVDIEAHIEVVGQVDFVVEHGTSRLGLSIRGQRDSLVRVLIARRAIDGYMLTD